MRKVLKKLTRTAFSVGLNFIIEYSRIVAYKFTFWKMLPKWMKFHRFESCISILNNFNVAPK